MTPDENWQGRARENGADYWHIHGTEKALEYGPDQNAVWITVRVPVEPYHRVEVVLNAEKCGLDLRGSRPAVVDGLRRLLHRLPRGAVVTDAHGAFDGTWPRDSVDAAVEEAKAKS